jgi:hypothetical protein
MPALILDHFELLEQALSLEAPRFLFPNECLRWAASGLSSARLPDIP